MPDGLAAAKQISRTVPGTAVAMLTTFSEDAEASTAVRGRASGRRAPAYVARALDGDATGFLLTSGHRTNCWRVYGRWRAAPASCRRSGPGASSTAPAAAASPTRHGHAPAWRS